MFLSGLQILKKSPITEYSDKYRQDWPVSVQDMNDELMKCGICGGYLGLVAQVFTIYSFLLTFQSPSLCTS
jgi:hypothetical protein